MLRHYIFWLEMLKRHVAIIPLCERDARVVGADLCVRPYNPDPGPSLSKPKSKPSTSFPGMNIAPSRTAGTQRESTNCASTITRAGVFFGL
ncbi:hypothetical protein CYPRO_2214 [Cyclonatronum proteinivorum]|uniref:Uncharacterized protein n=1 Tax=Cyclonatronum proteinivorum TaxID=1457365 RepID=A0A345ULW0_9BACT|nr:hypothetical protein CYPRO_2214 [Cyclonatronum proteinivorum]